MLEAGVRLCAVVVALMAMESFGQFLIGIPIQGGGGGRGGGGGGGRGGGARSQQGTPCRPLAIPNAVYSPPIAGTANISSGGRVMVACVPGFENTGADWVVCGSDGMWKTAAWAKDAKPNCQGTCGPLELANATFTPESAAAGGASQGATVSVACDEGFEYQGANPIVCKDGQWEGLGECVDSSASFCRDPNLEPMIKGLLTTYEEDPLKATQAINRYVLGFRGIRANGLGYIGLNPSPAFQPFETNAYYVPGITGSDATYTSVVLPNAWNMTTLPDHFKLENVFCKVSTESTTAYVLKVLYKESFGYFGFGNRK